jgi:hypothetical protein
MINESDYPPSPAYYRQHGADCRDLVTPEYWRDSAFVHLFRAGRKGGESVAEALTNAFLCLALWFRSHGLVVPYYSAELHRLRVEREYLSEENARFRAELAAITVPLESGPVSPTLDTPAASVNEWTDDELAEWLDANRCPHRITPHGVRIWDFQPCEYAYGMTLGDNGWHGLAIDHLGHPDGKSAREAARILNATKPAADPFAGLLSVETDHDLLDWFDGPHAESTPKAVYVGAIDIGGDLVPAGWYVRGHDDGDRMTAREAARTLHRILTGGAA